MVCINSYYRQTSAQSVFICKDNGGCGEGNNQRASFMMKMFNYNYCVSVEWLAPCMFKATVKRTTNTLRILPPTFKPVSQQIRLLQFAFILDSDWKKLRGSPAIRGSYVTCCKTSLPWAGKTRASCTDFHAKSRTTFYFGNNFPKPATNWFVARQIWFVGGKTRNIAIECFHMTSRRPYWCSKPILWTLNSLLMQTISFVPINLHRCWPGEWKRSIQLVLQQNKSHVFPARCIRNSALGIRSPAKDWNPEFKLHRQVLRSIIESLNNQCPLLNNTVWNLKGSLSQKR